MSGLEEALTKAERHAVTKRVRVALMDSVFESLDEMTYSAADSLVKAELKAAKADKKFIAELREEVRGAIRKKALEICEHVEVVF